MFVVTYITKALEFKPVYIPMRGCIKRNRWVITKISPNDHPEGESYHPLNMLVTDTWWSSLVTRCNKNYMCFQIVMEEI